MTRRLTPDRMANTAPQMTAFHINRVLSLKPSIHGDATSHALRASVKMLQ